jgi:acid phosphatase
LFLVLVCSLAQIPTAPGADIPVGCENSSALPVVDFARGPDLATFKQQLLYYRCTRYDLDIEIVMRDARHWLMRRAAQIKNAAVVLDIDDTSLSNWKRLYYKDGYPYIPHDECDFTSKLEACGDIDWQWSEGAPAVKPVLDFYRLAQCIDSSTTCTKVDVYFISGRHEGDKYVPRQVCAGVDEDTCNRLARTPREWTLENLHKAGFVGVTDDHLRMRKDSTGSVSDYKTNERAAIEASGKPIIANVGDQDSDLIGFHAERTFKLPNPFYFIP